MGCGRALPLSSEGAELAMGEWKAYPSGLTDEQWAVVDLPPKSATYYVFALWRYDGTGQAIHDVLRCQAREKAGQGRGPGRDDR